MRLWLVCGIAAALSACHADAVTSTEEASGQPEKTVRAGGELQPVDPALGAQRDALMEEIQARIGGAVCSEVNQCRVLPVGHKPCGGPSHYLVYSTQGVDEARLKTLAEQHTAAARAAERPGMVSTCEVVEPPQLSCEARRCVAVPGLPGIRDVQ